MSKSTLDALLSRGLDTHTAQRLVSDNLTVGKLKEMTELQLQNLSLSNSFISSILKESRPPIPRDTIIKLLYESRRTCCICRDHTKSVIIHHIEEWHKTKSHDENNLVVLCLQHHDEAHSVKTLSINLNPPQIKYFKTRWCEEVNKLDARTILGLKKEHSRWDYVNINRLFELFLDMDIDYYDIKSFTSLRKLNIIDENGIPTSREEWKTNDKPTWHYCDFGAGIYLGHYLREITERVISDFPLIDLTNNLSITFIKSIVKAGSIITAQLGFYFADIDKFEHVNNALRRQLRKAYYKGNSIRIEFQFDASECTSSSGRFDALTGHNVAVPILFVRSLREDNDKNLIISCSCLAIGTWFENHRVMINR